MTPLTWTRRHECAGCGKYRETYAANDGLRCWSCLPDGWSPPDAATWLAKFGKLVRASK